MDPQSTNLRKHPSKQPQCFGFRDITAKAGPQYPSSWACSFFWYCPSAHEARGLRTVQKHAWVRPELVTLRGRPPNHLAK
eukprot:5868764-Amphidinium_carterae.1